MAIEVGSIIDKHPCYPCIKCSERGTEAAEKAVIIERMDGKGEITYECGRGMSKCSILESLRRKSKNASG